MTVELQHAIVRTSGARLHVVEAGPSGGPPVVLLHGFPEFWWGWREQIGPLAAAGYRLIVPDQRGYNLSSRPHGLEPYRLDRLAADVADLIEARAGGRASVVGHDWGGLVAGRLAQDRPDVVERLALLNGPLPAALGPAVRRDPTQLARSAYVIGFQLPWLPELAMSLLGYRALAKAMRATAAPGTFPAAALARYRQAWSQAGALTAMLAWYRAAWRHPAPPAANDRVRALALVIWGAADRFLSLALARASAELCDDARLEILDGATHWLHLEQPERVNRLLLGFLPPT